MPVVRRLHIVVFIEPARLALQLIDKTLNLTLNQAIDINVPIGCGDAPVFPGDVVVGDNDGVIILPAALADEIAEEAVGMTAYEDFVTERVRAGHTIVGLYPATDEKNLEIFAEWRHRYAPGVVRNREHVFGLCVPLRTPGVLSPREHDAFEWLPWQQAADRCFSASNAEACLLLPRFTPGR